MPVFPLRISTVCAVLLSLTGCANDKHMHFVAGAAAAKFSVHQGGTPMTGCLVALSAGVLKEAIDSQTGGVVDRNDALATAAGCAYTLRF